MKKAIAAAVIAILSVLVTESRSVIPFLGDFIEVVGLKSLDLQLSIHSNPSRADRRIIMVEVDQASLDYFERDNIPFPWPRSLYNPLMEYVSGAGAKWIMFDILFNNSLQYGPDDDERFAEAIKNAGNVALSSTFSKVKNPVAGRGAPSRLGASFEGEPPEEILKNSISLPIPEILSATRAVGSVTYTPDPDGVYRRVEPVVIYEGAAYPGLFASPVFADAEALRFEKGGVSVGDVFIPLDERGKMLINYAGGRGVYRRYSAAAVIVSALRERSGEKPIIPGESFKDAYVIVGYTAPGLYDLKPTPLSERSPGMEIHAAALDTILSGRFLEEAPRWLVVTAALVGASAMSASVVFIGASVAATVAAASVLALIFIVSGYAFEKGVWLNLVTLETSAILSLIAAATYKYQTEGRQKRFINRAFRYYVSPGVVDEIISNPKMLALGGEKKKITIFFSDLVGFTSISEKLPPADLVSTLNGYTTMMADTITARDGTVDKYIGDAVMAFWGAPVDQVDQAEKACLTALECVEKLKRLRGELMARGLPPVDMRIGLNTGECVVGNMGSRDRFDYTALGDAVNLASRLEGLNNFYGTRILAAEPTWLEARDRVYGRRIDFLKVKGKKIPILVYEIMAEKGKEADVQRRIAEAYEEALDMYMARRWDDALLILRILKDLGDKPAAEMLKRVERYRLKPPGEDWDGAHVHTSK